MSRTRATSRELSREGGGTGCEVEGLLTGFEGLAEATIRAEARRQAV